MIQRGTTAELELVLDAEVDLTAASHVYVALRNGSYELMKKDSDLTISEHTVELTLTQEETLSMIFPWTEIQLLWTANSGASRGASEIEYLSMDPTMIPELLP